MPDIAPRAMGHRSKLHHDPLASLRHHDSVRIAELGEFLPVTFGPVTRLSHLRAEPSQAAWPGSPGTTLILETRPVAIAKRARCG